MSSNQQEWLDQVTGVLETLNQGVIINDEHRRVVFANSDLSGISIFEEAQYHGIEAARTVLGHVGGRRL